LADDHELFAQGIRALLMEQSTCEVVGIATDGRQAVRMARELTPDLVIIDANMPGMNGIEATQRILHETPATRVICLSMHAETQYVLGLLEAGGSGYLLKECARDDLEQAIQEVMRGRTYLSSAIAGVVVDAVRAKNSRTETNARGVLSDREREVLQLLAEGRTPREIAALLHLSAKTVASHREHIGEKLGIKSIAGLTKYAIREGLTSADPPKRKEAPAKSSAKS